MQSFSILYLSIHSKFKARCLIVTKSAPDRYPVVTKLSNVPLQGYEAAEAEGLTPGAAAILNKMPGPTPTPAEAGWKEQVRGMGISDSEAEDLDLEATKEADEKELLESGDDEMYDDVDYYELLEDTGDIPTESIPLRPAEKSTEEAKGARDLRVISNALNLLHRANKLQALGIARLQAVVKRSPSLAGLSELLVPFAGVYVPEVTPSALVPNVPMGTVNPHIKVAHAMGSQDVPKTAVVDLKPVSVGARLYDCPACDTFKGKRHGAVKGHINKVHLGVAYGPCPHCNEFTTPLQDCWRVHTKKCAAEHAAKGAPSSSPAEDTE